MQSTTQGAQRATLPDEGFVDRRQLLAVIPISPSTLKRRVADGSLPAPVRISSRRVAWDVRAVRAFIESRTAQQ